MDVSVVVPTFNEAGNVEALVAGLDKYFSDRKVEIIFVDDSTDDTPEVIRDVGSRSEIPVHLLHRLPEQRTGGLGGAVVEGFKAATGDWIVVMDGDLQHPPEIAPRLVDHGWLTETDVCVASRYTPGGDAGGLAGAARRLVSSGSTRLVKALFPRRLAGCSDPMTGFFAIRRDAVDVHALQPNGFKILLETLVRHRLRISEIPFIFGERLAGESKASLREGMRFLQQVSDLRFPRAVRFAAVGASGVLPNLIVLTLLVHLGVSYVAAAVIGTQVAIVWNFVGAEFFVWHDHRAARLMHRFFKFFAISQTDLLRLPIVVALVEVAGMHPSPATAVSLIAMFFVRYALTDRLIYRKKSALLTPSPVPSEVDV